MINYVNFEIAKLLKQKGFDNLVSSWYDSFGYLINENSEYHQGAMKDDGAIPYMNNTSLIKTNYTAPTIAEVVMWLYEKHELWIEVQCPDLPDMLWGFNIHKFQKYGGYGNGDNFNTPTEAYEAAIEYILETLI